MKRMAIKRSVDLSTIKGPKMSIIDIVKTTNRILAMQGKPVWRWFATVNNLGWARGRPGTGD